MLTDLNLLFQGKILYAVHAEKNVIKYESIGERIPCSVLGGGASGWGTLLFLKDRRFSAEYCGERQLKRRFFIIVKYYVVCYLSPYETRHHRHSRAR